MGRFKQNSDDIGAVGRDSETRVVINVASYSQQVRVIWRENTDIMKTWDTQEQFFLYSRTFDRSINVHTLHLAVDLLLWHIICYFYIYTHIHMVIIIDILFCNKDCFALEDLSLGGCINLQIKIKRSNQWNSWFI